MRVAVAFDDLTALGDGERQFGVTRRRARVARRVTRAIHFLIDKVVKVLAK
jgi:hypothetical protein